MPVLESKLDTRSEVFQQNLSDMHERLSQLQELYDEAAQGGGEEAMARLKSRNKMPIRERIAHVLDRDALSSTCATVSYTHLTLPTTEYV